MVIMDIVTPARTFIEKRRAADGFADFPGPLPTDLEEAYAIQTEAIGGWTDAIAGWKVGRLSPDLAARFGAERFIGPIFARTVDVIDGVADFPVCTGGFGAFEAEILIRLAKDVTPEARSWSVADALPFVGPAHIGIEVAGSPLASINDLGSLASIAGFGNNAALLVGPAIADWTTLSADQISCRTTIDGVMIREALASALPGGPMAGFAFALQQAGALGIPLKAGQWISTGAVTGVHPVTIGQDCEADFGALGMVRCRTVAARPDLA
ncbi:MAG: 2-keto-4-pentenoate hydratase [Sphingobium sp.]|nr:MAG: 2-keto-4-pentenoate hydratase [Sphingobium sp.]